MDRANFPSLAVRVIDWTIVSDVATLASALTAATALLCTFCFFRRQDRILGRQLDTSIETKRYELYQNVMKEMQEISRIFLSAPELRRYFYDGEPAPCAEDDLSVRVQVMCEMLVDFMGLTLNTFRLFSEDEKNGWVAYFQDIVQSSPAVRSYWNENREWYEPPVWEVVQPVVDLTDLAAGSDEIGLRLLG